MTLLRQDAHLEYGNFWMHEITNDTGVSNDIACHLVMQVKIVYAMLNQ